MKTKKLIIFNIFILLIIASTLYTFTSGEITKISTELLATIATLFIVNTCVSISYSATYAITKKNLLRISSILMLPLIGYSLALRIKEIIAGVYNTSAIISTILYILLLITIITISKDLHKLVHKLFHKQ